MRTVRGIGGGFYSVFNEQVPERAQKRDLTFRDGFAGFSHARLGVLRTDRTFGLFVFFSVVFDSVPFPPPDSEGRKESYFTTFCRGCQEGEGGFLKIFLFFRFV